MDDLIGNASPKNYTPGQRKALRYWDRWHDLRDIRFKRDFTDAEQLEYDGYLVIVAKLNAEEETLSVQTTERLSKNPEPALASIRRLTEAVEGK